MRERIKRGWHFCLKHKVAIISVVILGGLFFWFQIRPAEIKKECSWVEKQTSAVAEVTQAQADQAKIDLAACQKTYPNHKTIYDALIPNNGGYQGMPSPECSALDLAAQGPHPAVPSRNYYVAADSAQYSFCLHSHGL